jgi:hypothetical protein
VTRYVGDEMLSLVLKKKKKEKGRKKGNTSEMNGMNKKSCSHTIDYLILE